MDKIIQKNHLNKFLSFIKKTGKKIIVAGGCFDILHTGHLNFFLKAKKKGELLIILLESDKKVSKLKGPDRPIFTQKERAFMLANICSVDYVYMLDNLTSNRQYERLLEKICPDIIAVTYKDPYHQIKQKQALALQAKLRMIPFIKSASTSIIINKLNID